MKLSWIKNRRQAEPKAATNHPWQLARAVAPPSGTTAGLPQPEDKASFYRYLAIPTYIRRGITINSGL